MKQKIDYHAKLIIRDLPTMSEYRKSRLVQWLLATVDDIQKEDQKEFSKIYTLKLMK